MEEFYLRLVLEGDVSKFSWFIDRYKDMAFSIAYRVVNNREDAEEVVQDAFLKVFKSLEKFRRGSRFSTWLYRIVVNTALTRVRSEPPKMETFDETVASDVVVGEVESAYRALDLSEQKELVNDALVELNVEDRLILVLYYLEENTVEEISETTGIARENVKMKLHRARGRLYVIMNNKLKSEIRSVLR